ncbi:MAG TPA: HD domain-containing protein [Chromatiaceae bacterium]|nr:HD domain-containing protein [Chromatiaceae bacterium]
MLKELSVNFGNFLLSLSDAIDLASSQIALHQMRTAFIAWQIAQSASLPKERIENLFIASLFHDIGALSLEDKIKLHNFEKIDVETHCILGEALFRSSHLFTPAKKIVRYHHKHWYLWESPIDTPYIFDSQIIYLADYLERHIDRNRFILHQVDGLNEKIMSAAGDIIHENIVDLFLGISSREDFWLDLSSPRLYSTLLHLGPLRKAEIAYDNIFSIASLFRNIIDFKSRFTATHSTGVAECAVMLSMLFGLTETEGKQMKIAGYFHDLGKLAVPNSILEKPGKLTGDEFAVIKQHTYFTYSVLNTIGGLNHIAEWAAFHHEKFDGTGYPFHIGAQKINTGARIMAVSDVFTAITEDRPYRKGMARKKVETILISQVKNNALDKKMVHLLIDNFEDISNNVKEKQLESLKLFEEKFSNITTKQE